MLESRSYYYPAGEKGSAPRKWCVKFVVCGCDRGITGFSHEWEAKRWLTNTLEMHRTGTYFSSYPVIETGVYKAGVA